MKNLDYIVVGCGLAGLSFCELLKANGKRFVVFDDTSQQASSVAAGLYNPVILKRFSEVWMAQQQLDMALPMYAKIEQEYAITIDYPSAVYRRFNSVEEQNMWFTASDKPNLEPYLSTHIKQNTNPCIDAPHGFGEVLHAGRIDTKQLITSYKNTLKASGNLIDKRFYYDQFEISDDEIIYSDTIKAKHIVFAEGFGMKQNPFFKDLPLNGTKGEVITIKAPDLDIDVIIKSSVFIIPIGNHHYHVGATYHWTDKTNRPTEDAKQELITKLKTVINCDFTLIDHRAGIRPTVIDRRPLVGRHSYYNNLYVLNGLGTRGVMIGPYVAATI